MTRAVIYARYSTEMQSIKSCEDQIRACKKLAGARGFTIVDTYEDAAISGSQYDQRAGLQAMLARLAAGDVHVIVAEALDRLSRDLEDTAKLHKLAEYFGVKIVTVAEGEITDMHVGLTGTMNASFLRNLAMKVHRGLAGKATGGYYAGGRAPYGYRIDDSERTPLAANSRLVIDEPQAVVVRRIYALFIAGASPRAIRNVLNDEKVPPPSRQPWSHLMLYRSTTAMAGILCDPIYHGHPTWNRREMRKHPVTRNRVSRLRPQSEWITTDEPHLAIIDDRTWAAAQARIREIGGKDECLRQGRRVKASGGRHRKHLLSGILHCESCGSPYTLTGSRYYGCSRHAKYGRKGCSNNRQINVTAADAAILKAIRDDLFDATGVRKIEATIRQRLVDRGRQRSAEQEQAARQLPKVEKQIGHIVDDIKAGLSSSALRAELERLERERARLTDTLKVEQVNFADIQRWLPAAVEQYKATLSTLTTGMTAETTRARQAVSDLVGGKITVQPQPDGTVHLVLRGDYGAMVELAKAEKNGGKQRRSAPTAVFQSNTR